LMLCWIIVQYAEPLLRRMMALLIDRLASILAKPSAPGAKP